MAHTQHERPLRSRLVYEPVELKFGTSGRRGDVCDLTQLEIYINATAELEHLQSLSKEEGGIVRGDPFYFAYDLRPSSSTFVESQGGRGEIAQAVVQAVLDAGMRPVNLGRVPTPALTCYALTQAKGSIMVTGSHIPFSRNGYKVNTSRGELLKKDEKPIDARVLRIRKKLYGQRYRDSLFNERGLFKAGPLQLPPEDGAARDAYVARYAGFFKGSSLAGMQILCYQHSAVGRDLLAQICSHFGARVVSSGRSETFVPIDTENIDDAQLAAIQALAGQARAEHGPLHAVVSTDGDSDRPLLLGVDAVTNRVSFFGGDLVGMVTAEFLGADAVVVPISCNDAIDRGRLGGILEPKTRIGSPYVIEGMEKARTKGKRAICGWEANGGFLTGSDFVLNGNRLTALPTRDAVLPILCTLFAAQETNGSLSRVFAQLPNRFSRASLLKEFPRPLALAIIACFSPAASGVRDVIFESGRTVLRDADGNELPAPPAESDEMSGIRRRLERLFTKQFGFSSVARLNYTDGLRITFQNGDVAHVRPSGNADELRIYAVADSQARADDIARTAVAEPGGILRSMAKSI